MLDKYYKSNTNAIRRTRTDLQRSSLHGEMHYPLNLTRMCYGGRKMTDFMKATSGPLTAFPFLQARCVKTPSFKPMLFFSSSSCNKSHSFIPDTIKWILQKCISCFGLLTRSLLQLLECFSSILSRGLCHLNHMAFLLAESVLKESSGEPDRQSGTNTCTSKY